MRGAEEIQRTDSNGSDIDIDEAEESGYMNGPLYNKVYKVAEKFAGTCIGQYVTHKIDGVLKLIEDTAKWSLPPRNQDINEPSKPLERPLPWIPFIALILMLRLVRVGLSIAGLFIGNAPLVPRDIVYFIQTRRRKLQSMRVAGMKEIQKLEQEKRNAHKRSLFSRLTSMMSMAFCQPQLYEDVLVSEKYSGRAECSGVQPCQQNRKSSKILCDNDDDDDVHDDDENNPEHELTLMQVLDQYCTSSNEEDDPDYIPPTDDLLDEDTSTGSSDEYTSNQEDGDDGQETDVNQPIPIVNMNSFNEETISCMTNGNSSIENDADELILGCNANGEYLGKSLKKYKKMPNPIKVEPTEQEEFVSGEENNARDNELSEAHNSSNVTGLQEKHNSSKTSNNIHSHHHQQSVMENETNCKGSISNTISENGIDQHVDGMNGIEETSESGSPASFGMHGFLSTSKLEDPKAVHPEKRREAEAFFENENFIRAESSNKSKVVPKQTKSTSHSSKQIKNKFRGKRR